MKNLIKIIGSALVATLVLSSTAFAAPGTGNGGTTSGSSVPSTGNGGTTAGNGAPSTGNGGTTAGNTGGSSNGGSSNNGGNTASVIGSVGRSSARVNISLTNVNVAVVGNKATVTWNTTPNTQSMIVYGPASLATPNNATEFYGYPTGMYGTSGLKHSFTFTMAPGTTYFVRPVAIIGMRVVFGSEIKVNGASVTKKTAAPAVGTIDGNSPVKIETSIPADVEVSKAPSKNVANTISATSTSAFTRFFKRAWNSITSPFCN